MAKTTGDVLKVSDCHHGGYRSPEEWKELEKEACPFPEAEWICVICKQPCKVVELLVEEK